MIDKSIFGGAFEKKILNTPYRALDGKFYKWGGAGETEINNKTYIKNDTLKVLAQDNAIGLNTRQANLIVSDDKDGKLNRVYQKAFFQIGIDQDGNDMFVENDLVAAPCPPYCGGGRINK